MKKIILIPILGMCSLTLSAQRQENAEWNSSVPGKTPVVFFSSGLKSNKIGMPADGSAEEYLDGQLLFKGTIKRNKLQGSWQSHYPNTQLLDSGYFKNGVPHGEWKHWDSSGQLIAIRNYDADKMQRVKQEMRLDHPKRNSYPIASLYKRNRQQALWYLHAGYSFPGIDHRSWSLRQLVEANQAAAVYIPVFTESLHHGLYMNFFPDGTAKDSGYYKNGLKEAVWIHRNEPDSYFITGAYRNGLRYREWKQYNASGQLQALIFYNRKGEVEQTKFFR